MTPPLHLTPDQRRIVEHDEGPLVVIAGAGTGKTRVIVERVRHLLATHPGLLPEQLLILTYNVKAARELQERCERLGQVGRALQVPHRARLFFFGVAGAGARGPARHQAGQGFRANLAAA